MQVPTSLELEFPAQNIHQQLHYRVHRREGVGEEDEPNDDGKFPVEAKGLVQGTVVDEDGEEGKDVECVKLDYVREWSIVCLASH